MTTKPMTPEERALYDARADLEAWEFAASVLNPWVEATRAIGHDELTQVMEKALAEVEREADRALEALSNLEA